MILKFLFSLLVLPNPPKKLFQKCFLTVLKYPQESITKYNKNSLLVSSRISQDF